MRLALIFLYFVFAGTCHGQLNYIEQDNVTYTTASGQPQQLDLFRPLSFTYQRPSPAVVFVHGGGWSSGEKEDLKGWGQYYAQLGYVCISINYRMSPNTWPAEIDDPQAAVRWLRKNAINLNLNPNRIGAVGFSAGAHLVLFLGEIDTLHDFDPALSGYSSKVQAVAEFSGPTNFDNQAEWNPAIWQLIVAMVGPGALTPLHAERLNPFFPASPINFCKASDAPTIVFQGDADPVVPVTQARQIVARKQFLGAPVTYYEFPGEGHGFNDVDTWTSVYIINAFFGTVLGGH